jgi:sterol desaturase/sphingolipid hydroxylase (fatty acid hydroxylase superfamily)
LTEYWFHRLSHEVNLLWTAHVVHHQSRFFNLSVGLRTSLFVPIFNVFFYFIFPVLGFDPADVLLIAFIQGMYQLLIHTKLIGKLGWLEYVFVTPSAHRVHHGSNAEYLDKNYGKVFIVWDRLWKTFEEETVTVTYGLKIPQPQENPWQTVMNPMRTLLRVVRETKDKKLRRALLFREPDWAWEYLQMEKDK